MIPAVAELQTDILDLDTQMTTLRLRYDNYRQALQTLANVLSAPEGSNNPDDCYYAAYCARKRALDYQIQTVQWCMDQIRHDVGAARGMDVAVD